MVGEPSARRESTSADDRASVVVVTPGDTSRGSEATATTTADLLADLLTLIETGELDAGSPQARRMVRRIEGALAALRAAESGG
jgi:hypothetical protein